jgi:hypothetical protein
MSNDSPDSTGAIVNSITRIGLLSIVLVLGVGCARTVPVQLPQPIAASPDTAVTEGAIMQALAQRSWMVQERLPGAISAVLVVRRHKLWVQVRYDQQYVQVYFVGSENLHEDRSSGQVTIHQRANTWLANLQRDIYDHLTRGAVAPGYPAYAPAPAPAPGPAPYPPPAPAPYQPPPPGYR